MSYTQEIRANYEGLDTEELLLIARKDLTDTARTLLHEVLAGRGVAVDAAEAARSLALEEEAKTQEFTDHLASRTMRFLAYLIDILAASLVPYIVLLPLRILSGELHISIATLTAIIYILFRDGLPGEGLGKRLLSLRTIRLSDGRHASWSQSFWRNLAHALNLIDAIFALGERRMRLGDMIAGTIVVRAARKTAGHH